MPKNVYTELIPLGNGPVRKIRVSVEVEDDTQFFHPIHFAAAARYFAEYQERTGTQFSEAFGTYEDIKIGE